MLNKEKNVDPTSKSGNDAKPIVMRCLEGKHIYSYYWKRGKCKGSKCSLCGNLDRTLKPNIA